MATKFKKVNIAGVRPTEACSDQSQQQNELVSDNKLTYNRSTLAYWTALDKFHRNKDKPQNCAAIFFKLSRDERIIQGCWFHTRYSNCWRSSTRIALSAQGIFFLCIKKVEGYVEVGTFQELPIFKYRTRTINLRQSGDSFM